MNEYQGKERRGEHNCVQLEFIGKVKEFMTDMKGFKATLFTISLAVVVQVITFAFLWGGLTTTVKSHDDNLKVIMSKLDKVKLVGYVYAEGETQKRGTTLP